MSPLPVLTGYIGMDVYVHQTSPYKSGLTSFCICRIGLSMNTCDLTILMMRVYWLSRYISIIGRTVRLIVQSGTEKTCSPATCGLRLYRDDSGEPGGVSSQNFHLPRICKITKIIYRLRCMMVATENFAAQRTHYER